MNTALKEIMTEEELLEKLTEQLATLLDLAHKINNPLTSVMGRAQLLRMQGPTEPGVIKAVDVIDDAAQRITAYVRQVAQIAREGQETIAARVVAQAATETDAR